MMDVHLTRWCVQGIKRASAAAATSLTPMAGMLAFLTVQKSDALLTGRVEVILHYAFLALGLSGLPPDRDAAETQVKNRFCGSKTTSAGMLF